MLVTIRGKNHTCKKNIFKCLMVIFGMVMLESGAAQEVDSIRRMQEVVVTAQYFPQSLSNSVYKIIVIDKRRIEACGATNVKQVLSTTAGVKFSNDKDLGTTDILLMGMGGRDIKILLDGVPLADRGDTRESLNQIDISQIERIEIVEGPMSIVYGSDAGRCY